MTREEAIKKLEECVKGWNTETDHREADDILCKLLISLGYGDVVKEYDKVGKWYS